MQELKEFNKKIYQERSFIELLKHKNIISDSKFYYFNNFTSVKGILSYDINQDLVLTLGNTKYIITSLEHLCECISNIYEIPVNIKNIWIGHRNLQNLLNLIENEYTEIYSNKEASEYLINFLF